MTDDQLPPDTPWWARLLIDNAREAWKLASVWWPAICAGAAEVYAQDPVAINEFVKSHVPAAWWPHIVAAAFAGSIIARVVRQRAKPATLAPPDKQV